MDWHTDLYAGIGLHVRKDLMVSRRFLTALLALVALAGNGTGARAQQRATLDAVRSETLTAQASLVAARDELRFARSLVDAAARQRALAEGRYKTGIGNVIELYDALLTDVSARFQLVQARLDLATARARLQHALAESR